MNEAKFRAWYKEKNIMTDVFTLDSLTHEAGVHAREFRTFRESLTVMQYTGLKDKNGKELWEGDIIDAPNGDRRVVNFFKGGFYGKTIGTNSYAMLIGVGLKCHSKIIGNIYQDPELLDKDRIKVHVI